jgi:hypothetical protein
MSIYPNPTTSLVTIATVQEMKGGKITITNLTGSVVFEKEISNEKETISVADFAKGMYLVKLVSNKSISTQRLIVE